MTLLAPNGEFSLRALSVKEPFAMGKAQRHQLRHIARDADAKWVQDSLSSVDVDRQEILTTDGDTLPFDALLVAIGGRITPAFEHVLSYRDAEADEMFGGIIQDIEGGYSKSVAFIAPEGPVWPLPLYELALMTAERALSQDMNVGLSIITPEPTPLASFGRAASEAVTKLLNKARITVYTEARAQVPAAKQLLLQPSGIELHPDRMISMPRITGRGIGGLPRADDGFMPIDDHCGVPGTDGRVYAAGDVTAFPVKHGGLGAQQADTAAAAIAARAGATVEATPYRPVIHGMLLTGHEPLYLSARIVGGQSFESEVSTEPLWQPVEKVDAEELGAYLSGSPVAA